MCLDETELGRVINVMDDSVRFRRSFRAELWDQTSRIRLNGDRCEAFRLGSGNRCEHRTGTGKLKSLWGRALRSAGRKLSELIGGLRLCPRQW